MTLPAAPTLARDPQLFLARMLAGVRWATIAALLAITLTQPKAGRLGVPSWTLVVAFAAYCLLLDVLQPRVAALQPLRRRAALDLPAAALLYFLASEPGGPLFLLFLLAVDGAAASLPLRGTLLYTVVAAVGATIVDLAVSFWTMDVMDARASAARLVMLLLAGGGMALVMRRLMLEHVATQQVHDEAARLEEVGQLRAAFISSVSHDLRTPLTAARAALGLLGTSVGERLRPDEGDLLGNARRNIERLGVLIDDLLTFNQLEAGIFRLDPEPVDARVVIGGAVSVVQPLIQVKGQTLDLRLPEPLPTQADPRRLEQVLVNLLANANQHTPGGTRIQISGHAAPSEVSIVVRDDGPGIPSEALETIFQRFHRLGPADGGSGLGLAIARAIVELHGGRIWAESGPGQGTAFHVALPRQLGMKDEG